MYLGDDGVRAMVIICDHIHFSRVNGLKTASSLLKGRGHGKTHVTLIQGINGQWEVSLSINHLWIYLTSGIIWNSSGSPGI